MPGRVVVVGSVNVDLVVSGERLPAPGETVTGGTFSRHGGGKGANQAVAAARLGVETILVGAVGDDDLGRAARAVLSSDAVDTRFVETAPTATGVALILVGAGGENLISVAPGANATVPPEAVALAFRELGLTAADVVLVSNEIPGEAVVAALSFARSAAARTILNPAPASGIGREALGTASIVTPNRGELVALAAALGLEPADHDPATVARALLEAARLADAVVVTLGPAGALLVDRSGEARAPAPTVHATDATGAGDAFNGCLAASLATGLGLRDALRRAVVAGAIATTRTGAREGMPTAAALDDAIAAMGTA